MAAHSQVDTLPIIWKGSPGYEQARVGRIFNHRRPDRYPIAVVEASTEQHILATAKLAAEKGCRVSVRSGGHSWAAWSVRDGAILLDLGNYKDLFYDAASGIVRCSPSTVGRDLNAYLKTHGRLFAGGHCPDVGVGGFLLQGGMGWNCKNWGWACEMVKAIDVVTADAQLLHCDENQNSELFWAARGAGPGFPAIVTRFYLQTRPRPKIMMTSGYIYPTSEYRKAMGWITDVTINYDADTEIVAVASYPPGSDVIGILCLFTTFQETEEQARIALQKAQETHPSGTTDEWNCKPTTLESEYEDQATANPNNHRYCADNAYIRNDADVVSVLEDAFTTLPHKKAFSLWYSMAPVSRRNLPDMALSMQSDHYFASYVVWEDEKDDQNCQKWSRDIFKEVEQHSEGAYLGDSDFQVRRTRFWGPEQGKKLMAIRKKWDSGGRICGYLDADDKSQAEGLPNEHEWQVSEKL